MNKEIFFNLFKFVFPMFLMACGNESEAEETANTQNSNPKASIEVAPTTPSPTKNLFIDSLVFEHFIDNSPLSEVAYYMPTENPSSVIVFFDAQGRGFHPLSKYRALAKKHNYWLIGSNISKNGFQYDLTQQHFEKIRNWVLKKDENLLSKFHLAGFSGGARVAVWMAYDYTLPSVAGFCAGVPNNNKTMVEQKFYYGVTGIKDFNYIEMTQLTEGFLSLNNFVSIIEGKHDWADNEEMDLVFKWFKLNEIRNGISEAANYPVNKWLDEYKDAVMQRDQNAPIEILYNQFVKGSALFHDVLDISFFENEKTNFRENYKGWPSFQKNKTVATYAERSWDSKFAVALNQDDPFFHWNGYLEKLEEEINNAPNQVIKRGLERVYPYLSLVSFLQMDGYYRLEKLDSAKLWLEMLANIDPENPDVYYYKALFNANDNFLVAQSLDKAIALGFNDYKKLLNQKEFATLNKQDWINAIKKRG